VGECDRAGDDFDFRRQLDAVRGFVDHRLSGHHLDVRKDRLYCDGGTPAWHESRATLMAVYGTLLGLLDTLMPGVTAEMRTVCTPQPVRLEVMKVDPSTFGLLRPLLKAEDVAVSLQKETGLKRQDACLSLSSAHHDLLEQGTPDEVARWLKVDRVEKAERDSLIQVDDPLCPRCRLHRHLEPEGWCARCEDVAG